MTRYGYFDEKELASRDGAKSPFEKEVRDELVDKLNHLREKWGGPIIVNSAYRSPEHNKAVGGVSDSMHVQGLAADIRPQDMSRLDEFKKLCEAENPNGGVGLYERFVHIDVRGRRARWTG